jgi:NAD-dependent dihydropyrimidine dehydrogenase PreA subunit
MRELIYLRNVTTLELVEELCIGCGMCLDVCPHAVFLPANGMVRIGRKDACMECGACAVNCPTGALTVEAGVGCAAAVVSAALGRTDAPCCAPQPDQAESDSERNPPCSGPSCC